MNPAGFNGVFEVLEAVRIVLLAAPRANDYCVNLGFDHNPRAWMLKGEGR